MTITREMAQQHLDGLKAGLAEIEREYISQLGAIKECEFWLMELSKGPDEQTLSPLGAINREGHPGI